MGSIQGDLCTFCGKTDVETIHIFFHFEKNLNLIRIAIAKEQRKLELKTILLGFRDTKCPPIIFMELL